MKFIQHQCVVGRKHTAVDRRAAKGVRSAACKFHTGPGADVDVTGARNRTGHVHRVAVVGAQFQITAGKSHPVWNVDRDVIGSQSPGGDRSAVGDNRVGVRHRVAGQRAADHYLPASGMQCRTADRIGRLDADQASLDDRKRCIVQANPVASKRQGLGAGLDDLDGLPACVNRTNRSRSLDVEARTGDARFDRHVAKTDIRGNGELGAGGDEVQRTEVRVSAGQPQHAGAFHVDRKTAEISWVIAQHAGDVQVLNLGKTQRRSVNEELVKLGCKRVRTGEAADCGDRRGRLGRYAFQNSVNVKLRFCASTDHHQVAPTVAGSQFSRTLGHIAADPHAEGVLVLQHQSQELRRRGLGQNSRADAGVNIEQPCRYRPVRTQGNAPVTYAEVLAGAWSDRQRLADLAPSASGDPRHGSAGGSQCSGVHRGSGRVVGHNRTGDIFERIVRQSARRAAGVNINIQLAVGQDNALRAGKRISAGDLKSASAVNLYSRIVQSETARTIVKLGPARSADQQRLGRSAVGVVVQRHGLTRSSADSAAGSGQRQRRVVQRPAVDRRPDEHPAVSHGDRAYVHSLGVSHNTAGHAGSDRNARERYVSRRSRGGDHSVTGDRQGAEARIAIGV